MKVFLSHASRDSDLLRAVAEALTGAGAEVFIAEDDEAAGDDVHVRIRRALQACDLMVVILTEHSVVSTYVQQEIGFAKAERKLIIPMVTSEAKANDFAMLSGIEYIHVDRTDAAGALDRLSRRVLGLKRRADEEQALLGSLLVVLGVLLVSRSLE